MAQQSIIGYFFDVVIHPLFLGVVKAAWELISTWIVITKRQSGSEYYSKGMFEPIAYIGLDWMKILVVESVWVSDNYLAFCRLCKWYYSPLHYITEYVYEEPTIQIKKWHLKSCSDWLSAHNLNTKGKISELKERIYQTKTDKINSPILK